VPDFEDYVAHVKHIVFFKLEVLLEFLLLMAQETWAPLEESSNQDVTYHCNAQSHDLPLQSQIV